MTSLLTTDDCRELCDGFLYKLKILSGEIWEARAKRPQIEAWLANFKGDAIQADIEKTYALYLLTRLMFYGQREIRALLISLYRDLFRYPLLSNIRKVNGDTKDSILLGKLFDDELSASRFLGLGGSAKSGDMLLYHFRLANKLPEYLFTNSEGVLAEDATHVSPLVRRYVFIDDLRVTGEQAARFSPQFVQPIRKKYGSSVELLYFVMFATKDALSSLQDPSTNFDRAKAVHVLDGSFRAFESESRYFPAKGGKLDVTTGRAIAHTYGTKLSAGSPLGFGDCQLLLSFAYNTPDNTLPIIWKKDTSWTPIFERA